jgi:hypothetical protein
LLNTFYVVVQAIAFWHRLPTALDVHCLPDTTQVGCACHERLRASREYGRRERIAVTARRRMGNRDVIGKNIVS